MYNIVQSVLLMSASESMPYNGNKEYIYLTTYYSSISTACNEPNVNIYARGL